MFLLVSFFEDLLDLLDHSLLCAALRCETSWRKFPQSELFLADSIFCHTCFYRLVWFMYWIAAALEAATVKFCAICLYRIDVLGALTNQRRLWKGLCPIRIRKKFTNTTAVRTSPRLRPIRSQEQYRALTNQKPRKSDKHENQTHTRTYWRIILGS